MTAFEYIQKWLLPAWAQGTEVGRLLAALSEGADGARDLILALRRLWILGTSSGAGLDLHGEARTAPRWDDESDEDYQLRLMGLFQARLRQSTKQGMLALMAALGQPTATVLELYTLHAVQTFDGTWSFDGTRRYESPNRWAEFAIVLPWGAETFTAELYRRWRTEVDRIKPAHTKLAYFELGMPLDETWAGAVGEGLSVEVTTQRRYDGTWTFDGAAPFGPVVEVFDA
ncbi:MAG: hypothetical protein A2064_00665 [Spirochaetes bacterium GWB1_66_5]|nr:MAG: hypothetical protein A2064_00665 [Spirochaetes bacterium GWB1_66_5]